VGGAIGWLHESQLAAWMKQAVEGLEPGDVSKVVEAPFGCNVIEVVERRPNEVITWERAKDPLFEQLFERRMGQEYKEFIDEIREQTYIERKGLFAGSSTLDASSGLGDL
jgi:parvulin-like peptidyl-prolyl isomerase